MATELLEEARQTGTGERERPSVAMAPEPVYPACKKLKAALGAYQAAMGEVEESRGKASKAEADMAMLGDSTLSEADSLEAISSAHGRKELYASRIVSMERKSAVLLQEVRSGLLPAWNEVRGLVIGESERRVNILECRITEVWADSMNTRFVRVAC
jgi:hypothetical protein